jgi:hypothetical protein
LPTWKGRLLHKSGWLTLVRSTLSAMSIYTTISLHLLPWLQKALVKVFKAFLWTGTYVVHGGKCMVAWGRVARSTCLSSLGILDLNLMGRALQMR